MQSLKIRDLYLDNRRSLKLENLTGEQGLEKIITQSEIHRPGLALIGFVDIFSYERIQVLGNTEIAYLNSLNQRDRTLAIHRLVEFAIPCIIITNKNKVFNELIKFCSEREIPVFRTPYSTTQFVRGIGDYLEIKFAPSVTVHSTLVDVYGVGLLLSGRSGIGKSEVALDLIERGHRLVVDDLVKITRKGDDILIGSGNDVIQHYIEIRGLGIVDVKNMFGIRAIRLQKRIEIEVVLEEWDAKEDYERLGLEEHYGTILDVKIPQVHLPIFPGKNITVIVETIALNYLLKLLGIFPAKEFNDRLMKKISKQRRLKQFLDHDTE